MTRSTDPRHPTVPAPHRGRHGPRLRLVATLALVAALVGCLRPDPGVSAPPPPTTTLTIDGARPRLAVGADARADVALVNSGTAPVTWRGEAPAALTLEPSSGVLLPGSETVVTLRSLTGAPSPSSEVRFVADGVIGRLEVTPIHSESGVAVPAADASSGTPRVELGVPELRLGENTVAVIEIRNGGSEPFDWDAASDAPNVVDTVGDATGTLEAGTAVDLRLRAARDRYERVPGVYGTEIRLRTAAGERRVAIGFDVAATTATDRCADGGAGVRRAPRTPNVVARSTTPGLRRALDSVPGSVIVALVGSETEDALGAGASVRSDLTARSEALARVYGARLERLGGPAGSALLQLPAGADPQAFAARLARDPRVAWAEPNVYLESQTIPDDPLLAEQWALCYFGAPDAWSRETGAAEIVVAVIDEGVDPEHPDLATRLLPGLDLCPGQGPCDGELEFDLDPTSITNHGSHVTGIVAARGGNEVGGVGVAWGGTRVLPIKVFDDDGRGADAFSVAQAIRWAAGVRVAGLPAPPSPPARVINLSLGSCDFSAPDGCGRNRTLEAAAADATAAGALVVASAGNGSNFDPRPVHAGVMFPANGPDVLAVGAAHSSGQRASFSRFDVTGGPSVDLLAPGGIFVAGGGRPSDGGVLSTLPGGRYGRLSGTSMASPWVAGVAALVWSAEPGLRPDEVRERLLSASARADGWDAAEYGAGVLCPDAALGLSTRCGR